MKNGREWKSTTLAKRSFWKVLKSFEIILRILFLTLNKSLMNSTPSPLSPKPRAARFHWEVELCEVLTLLTNFKTWNE